MTFTYTFPPSLQQPEYRHFSCRAAPSLSFATATEIALVNFNLARKQLVSLFLQIIGDDLAKTRNEQDIFALGDGDGNVAINDFTSGTDRTGLSEVSLITNWEDLISAHLQYSILGDLMIVYGLETIELGE